jgi:DNA-binding HxlR family transcriptional regulator
MQEVKRGKDSGELAKQISTNPIMKAIVAVIDGPNLLGYIYGDVYKRGGWNKSLVRYYFKKLTKLGILTSLTPELKGKQPGRVYDFTRKGVEIKKIYCSHEGREFVHKRLKGIDWYKYRKVLLGHQRVAIIKALDFQNSQRMSEIYEKIMKEFKYKTNIGKLGMARQNVFNTLQWLTKKGLVSKEEFPRKKKWQKPTTKYRLTQEGELMQKQIIAMSFG